MYSYAAADPGSFVIHAAPAISDHSGVVSVKVEVAWRRTVLAGPPSLL